MSRSYKGGLGNAGATQASPGVKGKGKGMRKKSKSSKKSAPRGEALGPQKYQG